MKLSELLLKIFTEHDLHFDPVKRAAYETAVAMERHHREQHDVCEEQAARELEWLMAQMQEISGVNLTKSTGSFGSQQAREVEKTQ